MSKRTYIGATMVGLAVMLTASALVASNMGFKLNYTLNQTTGGVSKSGTNLIALPDNRQSGMAKASDFLTDLGLQSAFQVQRFVKSTDLFAGYTGRIGSAADFSLVAGEGYVVKMKTTTNYIIVGSDDPALAYTLNQTTPSVSKSGTNYYAYNYHQTAATASALLTDLGLLTAFQVQRYVRSTDLAAGYTGRIGSAADFALVPGDVYIIKMKTTTAYTPSHY